MNINCLIFTLQFEKESRVLCQSGFPKQIPKSQRNPCSFRAVVTTEKIKNIMTGEANIDRNHNIERVLRSAHEIDQKAEMVSNLMHTGCPRSLCMTAAEELCVLFCLPQLHGIGFNSEFGSFLWLIG